MGAKQSKRSVDISGKEAEGAGEVAAAGAGGEGRLETIADADNLKPQINGDTPHIQPPEEVTEKEKQLDSGTPENEKDATTEKEKGQENDKEATPVTNGDSEQKVEPEKENGEATPEQEGKKPKKEKVKKKWSLRSISFSRKDKPKQEKKQKEEDSKTNGEPEKVPEEAAEGTVEAVETAAVEAENKNDKTPETPVTEPITNGSSTPESPKVESPVTEAPAVEANLPTDRTEAPPVTEPEQLPINGLSLDEPKKEIPQAAEAVESKIKETVAEPEPVPVSEIPVKTEVCVEQVPLVESKPPPLPANPPPSSVASFAATTMAPELTDASLASTAGTDIPAPPTIPITEMIQVISTELVTSAPNLDAVKSIPTCHIDTRIDDKPIVVAKDELINETKEFIETPSLVSNVEDLAPVVSEPHLESAPQVVNEAGSVQNANISQIVESVPIENVEIASPVVNEVQSVKQVEIAPPATESLTQVEIAPPFVTESLSEANIVSTDNDSEFLSLPKNVSAVNESNSVPQDIAPSKDNQSLLVHNLENVISNVNETEIKISSAAFEVIDKTDDLGTEINSEVDASGKPSFEKLEEKTDTAIENVIVNSKHISETTEINELDGKDIAKFNGNDETEQENLKNKTKDALENVQETECNGNINEENKSVMKKISTDITLPVAEIIEENLIKSDEKIVTPDDDDAMSPASLSEATDDLPPPAEMSHSEELSESLPPPPSELSAADPQDPLTVHDKIADLIPEVPDLPSETLQESASDVAVAN